MKRLNQKGFTLAELLIVVAIIAVLVAISIPVFSTQLEKAREAVDVANIRSGYAEVVAARMGSNVEYYKSVPIKQQKEGWVTFNDWPENLYAADKTTTLKTDNGTTFQPKSSNTVYVVTNGEGKAYVTTTAPAAGAATDVDTLS